MQMFGTVVYKLQNQKPWIQILLRIKNFYDGTIMADVCIPCKGIFVNTSNYEQLQISITWVHILPGKKANEFKSSKVQVILLTIYTNDRGQDVCSK